jgi:hypothetical protein
VLERVSYRRRWRDLDEKRITTVLCHAWMAGFWAVSPIPEMVRDFL